MAADATVVESADERAGAKAERLVVERVRSDVWRQRRFGNETFWNGQVDADGRPNGLAAELVPLQPPGTILCDSIRRFKGLDRPVLIVTELRPDDARLERLLYVGMSRALQHLVPVVTPEVARHQGNVSG